MSGANKSEGLGTVSLTEWVEDRRRTERVEASFPVHVRSSDAEREKLEEVTTSLNASRDGLYFATQNSSYRVGMSLVVTFPYSHVAERNVHFLSRVVRVDQLSDGQFGIGVELVMTIANKQRLRPISLKLGGVDGQPPAGFD